MITLFLYLQKVLHSMPMYEKRSVMSTILQLRLYCNKGKQLIFHWKVYLHISRGVFKGSIIDFRLGSKYASCMDAFFALCFHLNTVCVIVCQKVLQLKLSTLLYCSRKENFQMRSINSGRGIRADKIKEDVLKRHPKQINSLWRYIITRGCSTSEGTDTVPP